MAGQPQKYDQVWMAVAGQLLGEAESVEVSNQNSSQDVTTLVKGFSGETPGPDKVMVNISSFLPGTGAEFDFMKAELDHAIFAIQLIQRTSGKKLASSGFFRNVKVSSGVGQSSKIDAEFHGTPAKFE